MELTDLGLEVRKTINFICDNDKKVEIPQYVIMPNHVHLIIVLNAFGHAEIAAVGHGNPTLQAVIGRLKSYTASRWSEMCGTKHQSFWQRSYYDRIIRNDAEYERIWQYIDDNPARWAEDEYYIQR